jgi:hypothetical protein
MALKLDEDTSFEAKVNEDRMGELTDKMHAHIAVKDTVRNGITEEGTMLELMPLYTIRGEPYNLDNHYMFEPLFDMRMPKESINKCCRQVGKSLNNAGAETIKSSVIPHFRTLLVCPRFEQIKRLSTLYVQPFITESYMKDMMVDSTTEQSILQRVFKSGSVHYYSFAFLDAERIRSIAVDQVFYDEIQDLNGAFLPVIEQTMGGSKDWRMQRYAGTPKTLDNPIEAKWQESSKDVWCVPCNHAGCGEWNVGCAEMDLLNMIGDNGVICAHCGKPLSPEVIRAGGFVPAHPDRVHTFRGLHVTQPLHPFYFDYGMEENWRGMIKQMKTYPTSKFYNECLGESYDSADRLMTSRIIREMSISEHRNTMEYARTIRSRYTTLAFGIDWGGGGDDSPSTTVLAVGGTRPGSDVIETIFTIRLSKNLDHLQEAAHIKMYWDIFRPQFIAHDFTGAGSVRESMLVSLGIPMDQLIPFTYVVSPTKDVITFNEGGKTQAQGTRRSYSIDKPRSLVVMCTMIKAGKITLPNYEDAKDITDDLLNLLEERTPRPRGSDLILIHTVADKSDDFAHALNFLASGIWYSNQAYPDIAEAMALRITLEQLRASNPSDKDIEEGELWDVELTPEEIKETLDLPDHMPKPKKNTKGKKSGTPKFKPRNKPMK